MVTQGAIQTALVKVLHVRVQNRNGTIFRAQRITEHGEIIDTHNEVTVRLHAKGITTSVMPGQWWSVSGEVATRTFINSGGFEMVEDSIDVMPGQAAMRMPSGAHLVDYLVRNPTFNGIGRVTAERLWETFGESLFAILDDGDHQALSDVISPQKVAVLIQGWKEEGLSKTLQWLHSHGFSLGIGRRIVSYFGAEATEKISENPYRLLSFAGGWDEVDRLACEGLGVGWDDERRLASAVEEVVYRKFSLGDTYVPRTDLVTGLRKLLRVEHGDMALLELAIELSERNARLLFDQEGNAYSLGASILENRVVDAIRQRLGRFSPACHVNEVIRAYEDREGISLNKEQRDAVHLVADNHFAVVTGGAGCGKTTVMEVICEILEDQGFDVIQLALAGKAAKRMTQATGRPAMTLASFIKNVRDQEGGELHAVRKPSALVVDEASMVDLISFSATVDLISADTKIVLIGDPHQLPPVGPGLILHCLSEAPEIPHVELKVAKRFGTEIADLAHHVKDGLLPARDRFVGPLCFIESEQFDMAEIAANLYLERSQDTVVLCATRAVASTVNEIVQRSQSNKRKPLRLWSIEYDRWEEAGFFEGDLLICTKNHWDLGLQNGSMGRLVSIQDSAAIGEAEATELGCIEWDDGVVRPFHEELLDSLELGYALTMHKAQGSQWPRVVICLPVTDRARNIERSLVYTAITRAQSEVVMLGIHERLVDAVRHKKSADRRRVGLSKRLQFMGRLDS